METVVLDTNVILRYLTNDVPAQAEKVKKRFLDAAKGKIQFEILPITVVEIIFQLANWYNLAKDDICRMILALFSPDWIIIREKEIIFEAISLYRLKNIDIVDLLVFVTSKNDNKKILSFDKDFDKLSPKIRLQP
ncbi:hypothetical protein A3J20_05420 [Candidatus Gottesmanbacteria bacterium RIFCSPLOWO2_02_FULL_42_29]|uniref:PIN domain-containing protein n=2 Tax=Candidatus Gottesmaniibacteriota TaxID=1752720 RepID=A0A1F6BJ01_9BACT|nr:MAG: PilT protein domain protein [Candidatus Gottesmanbacteria bacterium GW2011_GWA2_42_18]KKS74406.1 MAG: PilT protein domain protein [Candidatus Gottesmanbacteria bacterium GW2011_GWC2_42_8]OGG11138.1 MAG: hypothetical protein A2781_05120 [Candidatus Gottesmanbacteria bacterium RIFCSPHIGHO2_01_FULL_42_27]OGG33594.1 MAG: hypothetical protein A3G68_06170 [Candidatus Gottesmanbacteria bacterium RIFCSPLOWO2_12_FULL_42_10]OGG36916.1 MAG: hypothetical protein A2968_01930 [Candidatus Gottesmanbac